jgi:DNA polymerase III gamma/tau subunit
LEPREGLFSCPERDDWSEAEMADDDTTVTDPQDEPDETLEPDTEPEPVKQETPKPGPPKDGWRPPSKAEWEALQRQLTDTSTKLKDSNKENAARRKRLEEIQRAQETEHEKAIREAADAARAESKPRIVRTEAKYALQAAEARPERVAALLKFVDFEKVEIDGDDVTGLDDQVEELKKEYPEFFKQSEPEKPVPEPERPRVPRVPVRGQEPADAPRSVGERVWAMHQNK